MDTHSYQVWQEKRKVRSDQTVQTDDEILHFRREHGATIFHPAGIAKMESARDAMAVVGYRMRVPGMEALRVVDVSVMPTLEAAAGAAPASGLNGR